jgi:hypothetical protein
MATVNLEECHTKTVRLSMIPIALSDEVHTGIPVNGFDRHICL